MQNGPPPLAVSFQHLKWGYCEQATSQSFCVTPEINMGFWAMLGNIAAQIGMRITDLIIRGDRDREENRRAAGEVAQPNWNDIVDVCDGIFNRGYQPVDAIGNMRKSLYEQDPQVLKLALKVLESVIEERGIPVHNDREATQFLRDMREFLQGTRDRGVMDGVFELNDAWSRACRNSPEFRGVGDLVEMLNAEGYRVLVTRDNRRVINENADATHCNNCDFQLPFDQLKHFCQYCNRIFCSNCCSYQRGVPRFQSNSSVCICHECKAKNNGSFSPQQATSDMQTTPKVYNNIRNSSSERSGLQNVRVGNVKNNEEDVQINLVVPRHIAEDPEGWTISVQCTKTDNPVPQVTARTEKKNNNDSKGTDEYLKDKLFEKDIWQDNSDSKEIVTKSAMAMKNKNLLFEHQRYEAQQEEEENALCRLNNTETEDKDLKLVLEHSRNTQVEDLQVQLALAISLRESEDKAKGKSPSQSFSECQEDDREFFLDITEGKRLKNNTRGKGAVAFEVCSNRQSENQNSGYISKNSWEKSRQQNAECKRRESDEEDENFQIAMRRSLQESAREKERSASESENDDKGSEKDNTYRKKSTCCYKHGKDNWEEEEALQRALRLSLEEVKQSCYNCGKEECQCDEGDAILLALEISVQESANRQERSASESDNDDESSEGGDTRIKEPEPSYIRNRSQEDDKDTLIQATGQHFYSKFGKDGKTCSCKHGKDNLEEEEALKRALKLSLKEVKQRENRYFEQANAKEHLESLGHCSKQDAEFPGRCEKLQEEDCDLPDAAREKIAIIEEEEIKLAIQLSLQEMLRKEENSSEESEDQLNSSREEDMTSRETLRESRVLITGHP